LAAVKSEILKQLAKNYPNFLNKDLSKLVDIVINNIKNSLKKGERVELRDIFTFEAKIQKPRISRNPQNNSKVDVPQKKNIRFKMSKKWLKKINEKT
tara:strand:+ start:359 stop:649 length:291 start_codon:yes stop_codon:yes gene_type:complete